MTKISFSSGDKLPKLWVALALSHFMLTSEESMRKTTVLFGVTTLTEIAISHINKLSGQLVRWNFNVERLSSSRPARCEDHGTRRDRDRDGLQIIDKVMNDVEPGTADVLFEARSAMVMITWHSNS